MKSDVLPEGLLPPHGEGPAGSPGEAVFFLFFSDLDGTLLDHRTYDWRDAAPALDMCRRRGAPVVLVSSKTRAEMDPLRRRMGLSDPFVSENGGGIFLPAKGRDSPPKGALRAGDLWKWSLGLPYESVVKALRRLRKDLDLPIRGFSDMNVDEIAALTGLDAESARLAAQREYDEPFIFEELVARDLDRLRSAAVGRGLSVTEGGRFHHLHGGGGKGEAVDRLLARYRERRPHLTSVALGDSPNDYPMLERAEIPVLVRSSRDPEEIKRRLPALRITRLRGPQGWNNAVMEILNDKPDKGVSRDV